MISQFKTSLQAAGRAHHTVYLRYRHISALFTFAEDCPVHEITEDILSEWLSNPKWALETRRSHLASARMFFSWAQRTGRITHNPAKGLASIRASRPNPRPTSDKALLGALKSPDWRVRLAVRLGSEAGLRRSEQAVVHARDLVENSEGVSLIVHGKGGKVRTVPLNYSLADKLKQATAHGGYAFPSREGGHIDPAWLGRLVSRALPPGVTPHSLRHRFATRMWEHSRDLVADQYLLGHSDPNTTMRYVRYSTDHLRTMVNAFVA